MPFLGAVISVIGRHWNPSSDQALELLRIRDVGGSHTPLLGAWSRWGWAHPGPALFWTLTPFYRVLGNDGVLVGVGLINLTAAIGVVLVGYRRGGYVGALVAGFTVALVVNALGLGLLIEPWNPWVAFLPFVLYLGLVWSVVGGDLATLPFAVGVGSFVVQTHVGYLPMVGGLGLLAVGSVAAASVSTRATFRSMFRRPLVWAAVVGLALWAPALVQQATGHPGNVSELITYVRHPPEPTAGWATALGTMGEQLRPLGPWVSGRETTGGGVERTASTVWALATIAAVAAAGLWARRRGATHAARLALVALVGVAIAVVATARVTGIFAPYVLRWWRGVAALSYLSIAWSLLFGAGTRRIRSVAMAAAGTGMVAMAAVALFELPAPVPFPTVSAAIGGVLSPTAAALDRDHRYLVRSIDRRSVSAPTSGLIFALSTRGFHVFSDRGPDAVLTYGSWRLASPDQVDAVITMVAMPEIDAGWHPSAGARVVATWDPLTTKQRARVRVLEARIRAAAGARAPTRLLLDSGYARTAMVDAGADRSEVDELGALQAPGDGFVVYVSPST
ncbi:MAG TPA: hypothetical protein VGP92_06870 [Acidimicrobiia bacterium]|nr:hypothetical protein [Acidimicrobiia bacterium]